MDTTYLKETKKARRQDSVMGGTGQLKENEGFSLSPRLQIKVNGSMIFTLTKRERKEDEHI